MRPPRLLTRESPAGQVFVGLSLVVLAVAPHVFGLMVAWIIRAGPAAGLDPHLRDRVIGVAQDVLTGAGIAMALVGVGHLLVYASVKAGLLANPWR